MDELDKKLDRLVSAARDAEPGNSTAAPLGFATRAVARAFSELGQTMLRAWEALTWRFLCGACAVALAAALFSQTMVVGAVAGGAEVEILLEVADETFEMALFP